MTQPPVDPPRLALYIFINKGLGMSAGKIAAQAAQAAIGTYRDSAAVLAEQWWNIGGHHATYVMEARDADHIRDLQLYLRDRGFNSFLMLDEGMTEVDSIVPTALAVEIVDKKDAHTAATFSTFKLYRDTVRVSLEIDR